MKKSMELLIVSIEEYLSSPAPVAFNMKYIGGLHFVFLYKPLEIYLGLLSLAFLHACLPFLFRMLIHGDNGLCNVDVYKLNL